MFEGLGGVQVFRVHGLSLDMTRYSSATSHHPSQSEQFQLIQGLH